MFRQQVKSLSDILQQLMRQEGLETPLQARYTGEKFIKNQTLHVKITNPALRQDLSMMRSQLVKRLNEEVGALVITEVKVY